MSSDSHDSQANGGESPGRPARVLVINDDIDFLEFVKEILEQQGYEVACEHDSSVGLDRILECPPDIVVLDDGMPILDGLEVLERVRRFNDLPVIFMSADCTQAKLGRAKELGASACAGLPFTQAHLLDVVERLLAGETIGCDEWRR